MFTVGWELCHCCVYRSIAAGSSDQHNGGWYSDRGRQSRSNSSLVAADTLRSTSQPIQGEQHMLEPILYWKVLIYILKYLKVYIAVLQ